MSRPTRLLLVALSVIAWSLLNPNQNIARARRPQVLPAQLDAAFLEDLEHLIAAVPVGDGVLLTVPVERSSMASWHWTMAAFLYPDRVWRRDEREGGTVCSWVVGPRRKGPAPTAVCCGQSWCLWRR